MTTTLGNFLLDTNIAISLLRSDPVAEGRRQDADEVSLNLIVVGELYLGVEGSSFPGERRKVVDLLSSLALLADDSETARTYARLKHDLRRRGTPIPTTTSGSPPQLSATA